MRPLRDRSGAARNAASVARGLRSGGTSTCGPQRARSRQPDSDLFAHHDLARVNRWSDVWNDRARAVRLFCWLPQAWRFMTREVLLCLRDLFFVRSVLGSSHVSDMDRRPLQLADRDRMNLTAPMITTACGATTARAEQMLRPLLSSCDRSESNTPLRVAAFSCTDRGASRVASRRRRNRSMLFLRKDGPGSQ